MKACFLVHNRVLTVPTRGRRGKGVPWGLFYKDTNPINEGSTLMT